MATKISKVERLMNLVIALLSAHSFVTAEKIRDSVIGYGECPSDEAFSRMFERDKSELRDLGIPLETGKTSGFDPVEGYRIKHSDYALPDVDLTPDEAAAVAVATKLWESPERITAAQNAVLKLRAAGIDVDEVGEVAISTGAGPAGLRGSDAVLGALMAAIDARQAVQFQHRPNPAEAYTVRTVEPWGVVTARGRWYLVGHDVNRDATRTFRLSRVIDVKAVGPQGKVHKPEVDLRTIVNQAIGAAVSGGAATASSSTTVPAAASILAIALRAAVGSTTPGMSESARSATSSPVASVEVSRNGSSIPAEKVTEMESPDSAKSIRSPGP